MIVTQTQFVIGLRVLCAFCAHPLPPGIDSHITVMQPHTDVCKACLATI
jgi:hypothetical protein